jgi:hypothetical protein
MSWWGCGLMSENPHLRAAKLPKKKRHFPKEESNEARKDRHWLGSMVF